jgi:hypothetical protein
METRPSAESIHQMLKVIGKTAELGASDIRVLEAIQQPRDLTFFGFLFSEMSFRD